MCQPQKWTAMRTRVSLAPTSTLWRSQGKYVMCRRSQKHTKQRRTSPLQHVQPLSLTRIPGKNNYWCSTRCYALDRACIFLSSNQTSAVLLALKSATTQRIHIAVSACNCLQTFCYPFRQRAQRCCSPHGVQPGRKLGVFHILWEQRTIGTHPVLSLTKSDSIRKKGSTQGWYPWYET